MGTVSATATARIFGQRQAPLAVRTEPDMIPPRKSRRKSHDELQTIVADQRKYRRIKVRLSGRFMREDQQEYPCYTNDISAGGMNISATVNCEIGEYIIFYIEELGRIEGHVVRNHDDGFAITIEASDHKREKLVASLTWILNRHELDGIEARQHLRDVPSNPTTKLVRADGSEINARIMDLSIGGARVKLNANLKTGEKVWLGKSSGYVVRVGKDDIAIQFETDQSIQIMHGFFS
ncbi:MAG: PilZ domain-containing protein [Hyphomicrobiaceae bacterium]|nr:PilZ domain-containing protein [Hyphomicrobiaceae bacterium]